MTKPLHAWASGWTNAHESLQGRFEPIDAILGGYIYLSTSLTGAVAEEVLRDMNIKSTGPGHRRLVQRKWLRNKKIAYLTLKEDSTGYVAVTQVLDNVFGLKYAGLPPLL